jgi:hypothetical protein
MRVLLAIAATLVLLLLLIWPHPVSSHETLTTTVLFDREVVQVLNRHCVMCHFDKGPSFPLETYEQTWLRGRQIRASIIARHMPLWPAVSGYGQFANDNSLTLRETQFVVSWVEGLGPRNAGTIFTNIVDSGATRRKDIRAEANFNEWKLGNPDLRIALPFSTIEARQPDSVSRVTIATGQTVERRLRAIEYMPGDRRVTRAVFFTVQETGQWIGSWTPWYGFNSPPGGPVYRIPAGSHIAAEIYYRGAPERVVDQGRLGLFFSDSKAATVSDMTLTAKPSGARKLRSEVRVDADTDIFALRPDMIPGVSSLEVSSRRPDGGTDVLLFAKDFSLDWPTPFILRDPISLRKGAVLSVTATMTPSAPLPASFRLTINRVTH